MQKFRKLVSIVLCIYLISGIFLFGNGFPAMAQGTQTVSVPGSPSTVTLKGANNGSLVSFSTTFNTGSIPANAQVNSASISIVQGTNALGSTSLSLVDKTTSANLGSKTLATTGVPVLHIYTGVAEIVQGWVSGSTSNTGMTFGAGDVSNLEPDDNITFSSISLSITYTVEDSSKPVTSNIKIASLTETTVWITWITNEATLGFVDYGTSKSYGLAVVGSEYVINHGVEIAGLLPGTEYHFRLRNKDTSGNESISPDQTFTTKGEPIVSETDTSSPVEESSTISPPRNLQFSLVQKEDKYSIHIYWEASETEDIKGYKVYRSIEDRFAMEYYAEVDDETFFFDDFEVENDKLYIYTVRAFNDEGESRESNDIQVQIEEETSITLIPKGILQSFWARLIIFNVLAVAIISGVYFGSKWLRARKMKKQKIPDFTKGTISPLTRRVSGLHPDSGTEK